MKFLVVLLLLIETSSFASDFHLNGSIYKDYANSADISASYDIVPKPMGGLELALGSTSKKAMKLQSSEEKNILGGFFGVNITQSVGTTLLTNYKLRLGTEVQGKFQDLYFENKLGLILTSDFPVTSRGAEFGIGWKGYFKDAGKSNYRTENIYIYPYVGISI